LKHKVVAASPSTGNEATRYAQLLQKALPLGVSLCVHNQPIIRSRNNFVTCLDNAFLPTGDGMVPFGLQESSPLELIAALSPRYVTEGLQPLTKVCL
jgi:hypothetical protein